MNKTKENIISDYLNFQKTKCENEKQIMIKQFKKKYKDIESNDLQQLILETSKLEELERKSKQKSKTEVNDSSANATLEINREEKKQGKSN
jgi:hypothetical protein